MLVTHTRNNQLSTFRPHLYRFFKCVNPSSKKKKLIKIRNSLILSCFSLIKCLKKLSQYNILHGLVEKALNTVTLDLIFLTSTRVTFSK